MSYEQIVSKYQNKLYLELLAYIQSNMELANEKEREAKNTSDTIRAFNTRTGLMASFTKGNANNIFEENGILGFKLGTKLPYANIHEFGGKIRQMISEKQRSFFWFKAYQTGEEKYKGMALGKELNINIKARPYFEPAIKEWEKERQDTFINNLLDEIISEFNKR